jgi:CDP-glucose 4,6-dehydratase
MELYKDKKIIITGDTGFKGSWLGIWLTILGAKIIGFSNKIYEKSNYKICNLSKLWEHKEIDIRDKYKVLKLMNNFQPDIIFHLAAQSIVSKARINPEYTIETNILGTFNILRYLKKANNKCVLVNISSDKVYREKSSSYKEDDSLGSKELYGASKGCADIICQAFYHTYFKNTQIGIAISRAGNVIGGGDYSENRIVPDIVMSLMKGRNIVIRNPEFTRPWQYVLDALNGYLILGEKLYNNPNKYSDSFNFGPNKSYKVIDLVNYFIKFWGKGNYIFSKNQEFYESKDLILNSKKALKELNWKNKLNFKKSVMYTVEDYKDERNKNTLEKRIIRIKDFQKIR